MENNANFENWVNCWKESSNRTSTPEDESRTAERWNKSSATFGIKRGGEKGPKRTDNVFELIKDAGFNPEGAKVLDIGCGPGRFSIPLAKEGADVTAVDIASGMLDRLRQDAREENLSIDVRELSWWSADIDELGFRNKFDLVLASMTPAINGVESFERMIACSRGLCYYSNFVSRGRDPAHEEIRKLLEKDNVNEDEDRSRHRHSHNHSHGPGNGLFFPFMYLYLGGYSPDVRIVNFGHRMEMKPEDVAERAIEMMSRDRILDDGTKDLIRNYYLNASEDGVYKPKSATYTGMMVWKV